MPSTAMKNNGKPAATSSVTIRLAALTDLPAVVDGLVAMQAETMWALAPKQPDRAHLLQWLLSTLSRDPRQRVFVAEEAGVLVGLIGGEVLEHRWMPGLYFVQEWALWVAPDHRGQRIGRQLWLAVLAWAREQGAVFAVYGKQVRVKDLNQPRAFEKLVMTKLEAERE